MRKLIVAAFLIAGVTAPALAEPFSPEALFGGIVQERDVSLLFSYFREAFAAALQGRDVRPPYELQQRAEAIADEVKRRGAIAGSAVIDEIERNVREELRERPRIPPSDSRLRI